MQSIKTIEKDLLHLRYKRNNEKFENCGECPAFDLFDWVIWKPNAKTFLRFKTLRPRWILCLPHSKSLKILVRLRFLLKDITLIVAGDDTNLSSLTDPIDKLRPHCSKIYFEAKDIKHPDVKSFSMGFISFYLQRIGHKNILELIDKVRSGKLHKNGVLAAWGAVWKYLDDTISERRDAADYISQCNWISREELLPDQYMRRLAESKFAITPSGQGVQAPKLGEAWLMRTVPIAIPNPCFEDLAEAGFPFVFVDKWGDLTPELLADYERSHDSIDWDKVEAMLTIEHFKNNIVERGTFRSV